MHKIYYEGKLNKKNFELEGFWGFSLGEKCGGFRMKKKMKFFIDFYQENESLFYDSKKIKK